MTSIPIYHYGLYDITLCYFSVYLDLYQLTLHHSVHTVSNPGHKSPQLSSAHAWPSRDSDNNSRVIPPPFSSPLDFVRTPLYWLVKSNLAPPHVTDDEVCGPSEFLSQWRKDIADLGTHWVRFIVTKCGQICMAGVNHLFLPHTIFLSPH